MAVCLPADAADRLEDAVAEAMAPFYRDYSHGFELSIWDSMRIGGAGFQVAAGAENDPRLIRARPDYKGDVEPLVSASGGCTGGPRELLDFSATQQEARDIADASWLRWHELSAELPAAESWASRYARIGVGYSFEQASADYQAQPLIQAFSAYRNSLRIFRYAGWFVNIHDPHVSLGPVPREVFVAGATTMPLIEYSVLTLDGWWCEANEPGIHGACHGPAECTHECPIPTGRQTGHPYLANLPVDTLLVNVHCHI
jgi:hypothetical protein